MVTGFGGYVGLSQFVGRVAASLPRFSGCLRPGTDTAAWCVGCHREALTVLAVRMSVLMESQT